MENLRFAWNRLQKLSILHSNKLYKDGGFGVYPFYNKKTKTYDQYVSPPEIIRDNCEILGRGNEEEIKARILWYLTFYPSIFDAILLENQEKKNGLEI